MASQVTQASAGVFRFEFFDKKIQGMIRNEGELWTPYVVYFRVIGNSKLMNTKDLRDLCSRYIAAST